MAVAQYFINKNALSNLMFSVPTTGKQTSFHQLFYFLLE